LENRVMARLMWITGLICGFALVEAYQFGFGPPESELTSAIHMLRTLGENILTAPPAKAAILIFYKFILILLK
jgi:hypothetical protein